ncbi:MAG: serine/threonine-protein kinase, partial [Bacteroidota bacterium]
LDTEDRAEVEALLASHAEDPTILERAPLAEPSDEPGASGVPEQIGPYRIDRVLGRGGMGTVYLAERADGAFEQWVALKLVRRGLDTDDVLRRFRAERQILASLDHPNIARLLDGGASEDGRPFVAMEYVEGEPITAYADARQLSVRQRLALFQEVCAGVQAAHQRLVVHRDLKPSNILVADGADGRPQVKLLDFGIAKMLADDPEEVQTRTGQRLLTPEYAAPEQVTGTPVQTTTDVYQLGVLLYELLTGVRPYRLAERAQREVERIILEESPTAPSTAVTSAEDAEARSAARATEPSRLRRQLADGLDDVVLKALRKEPERRYDGAAALAADLGRYLDDLPVLARPDSVGYRLRTFVRRHRAGVATAAAVAVLSVVGVGAVAWQAQVAAEERDRAEDMNGFILGLFRSSDPNAARGDTLTVREVLDRAAVRLDTTLADQPARRGEMFSTIGSVYATLGLFDAAEPLFTSALASQREATGGRDTTTATYLRRLGFLLYDLGRFPEADSVTQESYRLYRDQLGERDPATAEARANRGVILQAMGESETAATELEAALDVYEGRLPAGDERTANALANLANTYAQLGRLDDAVAAGERARDEYRALYGPDHLRIAFTLINLSIAQMNSGDAEAALASLGESQRILETIAPEHPVLANVAVSQGNALRRSDPDAALARYEVGVSHARSTLGEAHPTTAQIMLAQASHLQQIGRLRESAERFDEAEAIVREAFPPDHWILDQIGANRASLARSAGRMAEAERLYRGSLAGYREAFGDDHPRVATSLVGLGGTLAERGTVDEAETLLREAVSIRESALDADAPELAEARAELGAVLLAQGNASGAEALLAPAVETLETEWGRDDAATARAREALAAARR